MMARGRSEALVPGARNDLSHLLVDGLRHGGEALWITDDDTVTRATFEADVSVALQQVRAWGLAPGARVALHGAIDLPLLTAFVACLLEGIVVVPVDAALAPARKAQMLALSAPALLLDFTEDAAAPAWSGRRRRYDPEPWPAQPLNALPLPALPAEAPCYVFFTSGTTGTPKGILGRRGGLAHFVAWEAGMLRLGAGDRVGLLTRLSFDVVLRDLLLPIAGGAAGCLPPEEMSRAAAPLWQWLQAQRVSVLHAVPSLAQSWLAGWPAGARNETLRHALFAGEPLTDTLVTRWRQVFPGARVHNLYGPTETTLAKLWAPVPDPAPPGIQCCGWPLPETTVLVVDDADRTLPVNELGEVVIRTPHASLGYLDPAEAAAVNFRRIDGVPSYRTGDLGFLDGDGCLHLRGRKDHQVKINGVRVEPVGVAAVLQAHELVEHAAVLADRPADAGPRLTAYYTVRAGRQPAPGELRAFLADRLPAAAIPAHFMALARWPVTANGKLDREQLPPPAEPDVSPQPAADASVDDLEQAVREAMAQALKRAGVGPDDDFFALGGDSLAAVDMSVALEARGAGHVAPPLLLRHPTARALADHLRGAGGAAPPPIPPVAHARHFALSPQQRRYFHTFCAGGSRSWCNMVALFDLPDGTDAYAVHHALSEIALRHDSLRLRFSHDEHGHVRQGIDPTSDFAVPVLDLEAVGPSGLASRLQALCTVEGEREIPLFGAGPLFRATLLRLPDQRRKLLWNVHHLVSDGRSQALLASELAARLEMGGVVAGPRVSIRDISAWAWQREGLAAAREHVGHLLAPAYDHRYLPMRLGGEDVQRCHAYEAALDGRLRVALRAAARRFRCTPYVLFVAAYFACMSTMDRVDDLVVVTPLAGRGHPRMAGTIGNFINLVPMRVRGLRRLAGVELLAAVKQQIAAATQHQAWQFDEVLDQLGIAHDPDRNPLTGYSINYMPQGAAATAPPAGHVDRGYKLKYDVLMLVREFSDAVRVEIQYRVGLLSPGDVERLFATYCGSLAALEDAVHAG